MKRLVFVASLILLGALAGCVEWSEDETGHLQSFGVPGVPIWQSKNPPAQPNQHEAMITSEEAARMKSGPVLVMPSANGHYSYRSYEPGQNHCEEDLKLTLADRARTGASGPIPYCATMQVGPVTSHGTRGLVW